MCHYTFLKNCPVMLKTFHAKDPRMIGTWLQTHMWKFVLVTPPTANIKNQSCGRSAALKLVDLVFSIKHQKGIPFIMDSIIYKYSNVYSTCVRVHVLGVCRQIHPWHEKDYLANNKSFQCYHRLFLHHICRQWENIIQLWHPDHAGQMTVDKLVRS